MGTLTKLSKNPSSTDSLLDPIVQQSQAKLSGKSNGSSEQVKIKSLHLTTENDGVAAEVKRSGGLREFPWRKRKKKRTTK